MKNPINIKTGRANRLFLIILLITPAFLFSCKEKRVTAHIEFLDPMSHEFSNLTWNPGDLLEFSLRASIPNGRMRVFEVGLGRYTIPNSHEPVDILFRETLVSETLEEIFYLKWELPEGLEITSEINSYRVIMTNNPERQPLEEGGNWFSAIVTIVENE